MKQPQNKARSVGEAAAGLGSDGGFVDVGAKLLGAEPGLRRLLGGGVALSLRIASDVGLVDGDWEKIEALLFGWVVSARDAMQGYGNVTIRLHNIDIKEDLGQGLVKGGKVVAGSYVLLAVQDSRVSVEGEEEAAEEEEGEGEVWREVEARPKQYTRRAYWRRFRGGQGGISVEEKRGVPTKPSEREMLLLVEDDALVRFAMLRGLLASGYRVLAAATGEEAMALCEAHEGAIDLLITDMLMPGVNGAQLAKILVGQGRVTRVLFVSGYPSEMIHRNHVLDLDAAYLQKPFTPTELEKKIRWIFDTRPTL